MPRLFSDSAWKLHFSTITFLLSLIVFSILLCLKCDSSFSPSYVLILIPWFVALAAMCLSAEFAINSSSRGNLDFAKNLTRLGSITIVGLVASASVLIALKLDDVMDTVWAIPFAPIWVALALYCCILVLLFPGLIDPTINLHRIAFLSVLYLCTATISTIFIVLHLDLDVPTNWSLVFLTLWIAFGLHFISLVCYTPKPSTKSEETSGSWGLELMTMCLIASFCILLNVNADAGGIPASIIAIPFWGLVGLAGFKELLDYWTADSYVDL